MRVLERRSLKSRACSRDVLLNGLRVIWILAIVIGEVFAVFFAVASCSWPDKPLEDVGSSTRPTHVMVITDPQVRHRNGNSWLSAFQQSVADANVRKSWSIASSLHPHAVVCLGDMLASGRTAKNDEEYAEYYEYFRNMFPVSSSVPIYYLPGNNDVGLGRSESFSKNARRRFTSHFGPLNQNVTLGGHTFVMLDSPGLVEEDYRRHANGQQFQWTPTPGGSIEFVKSIAADDTTGPTILFSHIPLSHPDTKSCGPLRESGTIRRSVGPGYQSTLDKHVTEFLLETLRPAAIFSGDDRDYCEYTHSMRPSDSNPNQLATVREVTVKSFSIAQNIRRPGFQLLSLVPPSSDGIARPTIADTPCLFPNHNAIVSSFYLPLSLLTIGILLIANIYRARSQMRLTPFPTQVLLSPSASRPPSPGGRPHSAVWSPWSPITPISGSERTSPVHSFPGMKTMRTPNGSGTPSLRAVSYPSSPTDSPLLTPSVFYPHDEEESGDSMFPGQRYRDRDVRMWPSGYDEDDHSDGADFFINEKALMIKPERNHRRRNSEFLPAPGRKLSDNRAWSYSWSFIFRGRRRRMTLCVPSVSSFEALQDVISDLWNSPSMSLRKRSVVKDVIADALVVAWPVVTVWMVMMRWMF